MKIWDYLSDYKFGVFNSYWWRDFWYAQISSRIRPRNQWLTRQIPRIWQDKDTLLEICVLSSLKHYVDKDGEDAFHRLSIDNPPEQAKFMADVKHYYELITIKLPALEKELKAEWDNIPQWDIRDLNKSQPGDYERIYGAVNRLEQEVYNLKTEIMVWVISNRNGLWT